MSICVEALEISFAPKPYYFNRDYEDVNESWMNEDHYNDIHFTITLLDSNSVQMLEFNQPHYA